MAIKTAVVTATTTAAAVTATDSDDLRGQGLVFKNTGPTNTAYLGGSDVTAANGYPIAPGEALTLNAASSGDAPYLITSTSTTTVAVLRTGA